MQWLFRVISSTNSHNQHGVKSQLGPTYISVFHFFSSRWPKVVDQARSRRCNTKLTIPTFRKKAIHFADDAVCKVHRWALMINLIIELCGVFKHYSDPIKLQKRVLHVMCSCIVSICSLIFMARKCKTLKKSSYSHFHKNYMYFFSSARNTRVIARICIEKLRADNFPKLSKLV